MGVHRSHDGYVAKTHHREHSFYSTAAETFGRNESLTAVAVRPSLLSGTRNIVEVIFSYTNRTTDIIEKFFVRFLPEAVLYPQAKLRQIYTENSVTFWLISK